VDPRYRRLPAVLGDRARARLTVPLGGRFLGARHGERFQVGGVPLRSAPWLSQLNITASAPLLQERKL
jgi:hypothetical protein